MTFYFILFTNRPTLVYVLFSASSLVSSILVTSQCTCVWELYLVVELLKFFGTVASNVFKILLSRGYNLGQKFLKYLLCYIFPVSLIVNLIIVAS